MKRSAYLLLCLALMAFAWQAGGCTAYDVAMEERNVGDWANDNKIALTIEKDFLNDDQVKYLDFDAYSYEGRVYIVGEYESRTQVDRAVQIARAVEGVRTVTTYVLPKRAQDHCGTADNLEIYAKLKKKLVADEDIWSTNIDIETIQCNVVLLGIVGTSREKTLAYQHAESVPGVRSVKSYLMVK